MHKLPKNYAHIKQRLRTANHAKITSTQNLNDGNVTKKLGTNYSQITHNLLKLRINSSYAIIYA